MNRGILAAEANEWYDAGPEWVYPWPVAGCLLEPAYSGPTTTIALTAGSTGVMPIRLPFMCSFNSFHCEVTTFVAASTLTLVVYDDTGENYPGNLVFRSAAYASTANAVHNNLIEDLTLPAGTWWVGLYVTHGITVRGVQGGVWPMSQFGLGNPSALQNDWSGWSHTTTPPFNFPEWREVTTNLTTAIKLGLKVT